MSDTQAVRHKYFPSEKKQSSSQGEMDDRKHFSKNAFKPKCNTY